MQDYTSKTLFVGIDVHKKTYVIACICEGELVKKTTLPSNPQGLITFLIRHFKDAQIKTVYEAGLTGFVLHRQLIDAGIDNIVINPASIEVAANNRVKTDQRDALKMAQQLSAHRLEGIYIPEPEQEAQRCVTRHRNQLVTDRAKCVNRIKSLLTAQGLLSVDLDRAASLQWIQEVKNLTCHEELTFTLGSLCQQWTQLSEQITLCDQRIKQQAKTHQALHSLYTSAPGIGMLNAQVLINEIGNMQQFNNVKRIASFVGLTPSEHASGEHCYRGHITRQGRAILRKVLVQAAWVAIRMDPILSEYYQKLVPQRGAKRAIVAIARKLIIRIRACALSGEPYQINMHLA